MNSLDKQETRSASLKSNSYQDDFDFPVDDHKPKVLNSLQWAKILKNNDVKNTSSSEITNSLRYGIPDELY